MSLTNYTELKSELAEWLHRSDLTSRIPDFIKMGEGVLNRRLRTVDMETRATTTTGTSSRFLALPTGFMEMRSLVIQDPAQEIFYIPPRELRECVVSETETGTPEFFTIKDEIEFNCIPQSAYTLEQHYFKKYDLATDETNWLMTNHPELYLHASLIPAAIFTRDGELMAMSTAIRDNGIEAVNKDEAKKRGSGMAYLRIDSALSRNHFENIING